MVEERTDWELSAKHMAAIRETPLFKNLIGELRKEIPSTKIRQCLSHHTTASCRKNDAPLSSSGLKGLGLSDPVIYPTDSSQTLVRQIRLPFQHTFYADDLWPLAYCSREYNAEQ